jgi:MFS family permease
MSLFNFIFPKSAYEIFSFPDFRKFLLSRVSLTLAIRIQNVTLGWQIYNITKDPLSLGFIGLAEALPALSVSLYAGYLADRFDRRLVAFLALLLFVLTSLSLFLLSYIGGAAESTFPLYVVIFISGIARGFYRPASFALMAQVVPRTLYAKSSAWNSTFWQSSDVAGAALGGVFIGFLGISWSYFIAFAFAAIGAKMVHGIKARYRPELQSAQPVWLSIRSGLKFVFKHQVMLGAMSLDLVAVLFGGAVALLPIFALEILQVGAIEYGFLNAAPSAGAIITAVYLAYKPPVLKAGKNLILAVAGFGFCMILFALSKNFYLSLLVLALSGLFDSISVVVRSSIMQMLTPDDMRGRVSAVNTMFIGSSNELGAFESGLMARLIGLVPSVVLGGGVAVVAALSSIKLAPKLRDLSLKE